MPQLIESGAPAAPDMDAVAQRYRAFEQSLASGSAASWLATFSEWDSLRRELDTWSSLTRLRFSQDTRDAQARAALERHDELGPALTGYDIDLKRRFVASGERPHLESMLGDHVFRLWETDLATFDPSVEPDLVRESKLAAEYTQLLAAVEIVFDGETLNLATLGR
jgi:hypothetical protein